MSHSAELPAGQSPAGGRDYRPLAVVLLLAGLVAAALQLSHITAWSGRQWLGDFMGFFFVIFAMLKLFDLRGFADGFQRYDLLAGPFRPYAYLYPFIELALGLGYLAGWRPVVVQVVTLVVMLFGALGVIRALRRGTDLTCACMGTVLRVPLSVVAFVEDLGMAAMAALMLFSTFLPSAQPGEKIIALKKIPPPIAGEVFIYHAGRPASQIILDPRRFPNPSSHGL